MHGVYRYALGLLAAAAVATASDVEQLKKDNFEAYVKENDIVLAECKLFPSPNN
ncbi:hypothetical protein V8F33_012731 [Rhypophila sp. PSN 637]